MADTKISALTGATTPLAGTEVVPVVQSSTTKNVSIANLTAGRSVSANDVTLSGGTANGVLYLNGSKVATSGSALVFNGTNLGLGVTPNTWGSVFSAMQIGGLGSIYSDQAQAAGGATDVGLNSYYNGANYTYIVTDEASRYRQVGGEHRFYTAPSGTAGTSITFTQRFTVALAGDVTVNTGNLVIGTSGKGIDFSATSNASGMTSELLDDYEEGTWTPTYVPASGSFGSITYDTTVTGGKYTKVGNLVHIQGGIRTDAITVGTASGGIRLGGLPFAAIANGTGQDGWSTLTIGQATAFAGDVPSAGSVVSGQSYFELQYRSVANGATTDLAVADLDTGADDNLMRFSATYITG